MNLAILVTNTDESAFAQKHPKDGTKFTDLIHDVRPNWSCTAFAVKDGVFPEKPSAFDGLIITGSPASVHDGADWIATLLGLIRRQFTAGQPIFGACFGHQAVALALGGQVVKNPGGWVHGLTVNTLVARTAWMQAMPDPLHLYGSHTEQVARMPEGAQALSCSDGCPVSGFSLGEQIYTTQHHPEMRPDFIAALTEELAPQLGSELTRKARQTLERRADRMAFAESIARFFEHQSVPKTDG
ncbi:type 1 glutamine amidotransferase [Thalassococcus sp. S3]|uniref:type 1 glutamine amidotransferase n=1 Tax=Thalassococcus sp. S3 TaxID=2017482 RepID=UPI00102411B6|nr:type 1 glutamine amidotransferase [Thalassococcus sp. S3]QBF30600.1 glutamine amidotransferase [Thalassococcus sp. S3]